MLEILKVPAEGLEARGRLMYNDYGEESWFLASVFVSLS